MLASPAAGQSLCDLRFKVVAHLAEKYDEAVVAQGVNNLGALVDIFVNREKGTWTITMTVPGGPTCLVAAGTSWRTKEPVEPEPEGMAL